MFSLAASMFSLLLVATGWIKLRQPESTAAAVAKMGIPAPRAIVMVLGFTEIGIGLGSLILGTSALFLAQGSLYVIFLGWVAVVLQREVPLESCGCIGKPDTPPYWGHVVVNATAVLISFAAALQQSGLSWLDGELMAKATQLLITGVGAFLAWHLIGEAARSRGSHPR